METSSPCDTIGGFNTFVEKQKTDNSTALMRLYLFDNEYKTLYENTIISDIHKISKSEYIP